MLHVIYLPWLKNGQIYVSDEHSLLKARSIQGQNVRPISSSPKQRFPAAQETQGIFQQSRETTIAEGDMPGTAANRFFGT